MGELIIDRAKHPRAIYLFAHGAGAGMRHPFMATVAAALVAARITTVRWEFPYMRAGKARVDPPAVAEAAVQEAWTAARAALAPELRAGVPMFAGGKSFGGRMTSGAHATSALVGLAGLVLLGFPLHPAGKPAIARAEHLAAAKGKLLFVSGSRDALADLTLLEPVVARLGRRAQLQVIAGADHGFTRPQSALPAAATVAAVWMTGGRLPKPPA